MFKITICGGHEGQFRQERKLYLTLCGACELVRPTLARQLVTDHGMRNDPSRRPARPFFITIMGATEIKYPTLAAEFIDLREMMRSGALSRDAWERGLAEISRQEGTVGSFTIMAGFDENTLPTEEEEIDSLAIQYHVGNIDDSARRILQSGIGRAGVERGAVIHRAAAAVA
jgi:hypothetical protein